MHRLCDASDGIWQLGDVELGTKAFDALELEAHFPYHMIAERCFDAHYGKAGR